MTAGRYYVRRHGTKTAVVLALYCTLAHILKLGLRRCCRDVPVLGPAVRFVTEVALPTALFAPLLAARLML